MSIIQRPGFIPLAPDELQFRAGDTLPGLVVQVVDDNSNPVDLSEPGTKAYFSVRRISGLPADDATGWDWGTRTEVLIAVPAAGILYYDVQPGDTNTNPGVFEIAATIEFGDGTILTVPTQESARIIIHDPNLELQSEAFLRTNTGAILTTKDDAGLVTLLELDVNAPGAPTGLMP